MNQQTIWNGEADTSWYAPGTSPSTYQIHTAEQLAGLAQLVTGGTSFTNDTVILKNDIYLNDTAGWETWNESTAGLNSWNPIGVVSTNRFRGIFDGDGHVIYGMYISSTGNNIGLFGYGGNTGNNTAIVNLGIEKSYARGGNSVGLLIGRGDRMIIENCYAKGKVISAQSAGASAWTGLLAGQMWASIRDCYARGLVRTTAGTSVGGLIGSNYGVTTSGSVPGAIQNCYATVKIEANGTGSSVGGFIGSQSSSASVSGSYFDSSVAELATNQGNNFASGKATGEMKDMATFAQWDFGNVWGVSADANDGYPRLQSFPIIPENWSVNGVVLSNGQVPSATLIVKAFDRFNGADTQLGMAAQINASGAYTINYTKSEFQNGNSSRQAPNLLVRVYSSDGSAILANSDIHDNASANATINVNFGAFPVPEVWTVYGKAFLSAGVPFSQGKIKAFDVSLEDAQPGQGQLGETGFAQDGSYTITYSRWNFQQGNESKTHPLLQIRIYDYQEHLLWQSYPLMSTPATNQEVNAHLSGSTPVNDTWIVHGTVSHHDGSPMTSGTVLAYDNIASTSHYLGQSMLSHSGSYSISFDKSSFQRGDPNRLAPNLMLRLRDANGFDIAVREEALPSANQTINFLLPNLSPEIDDGSTVFGQVVNRKGLPLERYLIKAYAMNFTAAASFTEILLGENRTNAQGRYEIHYNPNILSNFATAAIYAVLNYEELQPDSSEKRQTVTSPLVYGAKRHQAFNFVFDDESLAEVTEFADLNTALNKYLLAILATPEQLTEQEKLANFLSHPTRLQLAANTESKDSGYADCYFRAFLIAYELQERFTVARNNQTLPYPEGKYDALNYVEFFYALLRTGIISSSSDLLRQDPTHLLGHLLGAVSDRIIATDSDVKGFVDLWHEMSQTLSGDLPSPGEWTIYHILLLALNGSLAVVEANKVLIAKLLGMYYDAGADARRFLESVRPPQPVAGISSSLTEEQWTKIKLLLDLGDFGENYRDMIQASFLHCEARLPKITSLNGMLILTENDWKSVASNASFFYVARTPETPSGTLPLEFPGANGAEQIAIYARKLYKGLLAWFPQAELAANIAQDLADLPNPPSAAELAEWHVVSEFLSDTDKPPYYLDSTNLGVYLQENPDIELADGVQQKIRWLQRLFRLTEHLPSIIYLISHEIMSAYQIAQMSEDCFLADFSVGLGGMNKARHIHRLAVNYTMNASFQLGQYHSSLAMHGDSAPAIARGLTPAGAVVPQVQSTNLASPRLPTKVFANWKTLFGTINRNAAIKGQSILSPSAYLVDLLEFLKESDGYGLFIARRPDILNLELSRQNAEIALPMIDLAIELLEALAAPEHLSTLNFQTKGNSEDLRAQPEYDPNAKATECLLSASYPFALPANFSRDEVCLILGKLGLSWSNLALAFPPEGDAYQRRCLVTDAVLDKALRSPGSSSDAFQAWELWGLQETGNSLYRPDKATFEENKSWEQILSVAAIFLDRSGLALDELQDLLAMPTFKDDGVEIHATAEAAQLGDINGYWLTGINASFASKISRFVRLRRLLGWTLEEMDAAFEQDLDSLDQMQDLAKTLKVPVLNAIFWCRDMTDTIFAQVFRPLTLDKNILDAYKDIADSHNKTVEMKYDVFSSWINGRLGISQTDLDLLMDIDGDTEISVNRSQTEQIYRQSSFAKAVKLSISDFLMLAEWLSLPFVAEWSWADCQQFYAKVQELQTNPLPYSGIKQLAFAPDAALLKKGNDFLSKLADINEQDEIMSQLTSHFSITLEVAQNLLQEPEGHGPALLRSVSSPKAAWEDWIIVDKIPLEAYVRLSKAAMLVSALKIRTEEQLNDLMPANAPLNNFPIQKEDPPIGWDEFLPFLQVLKALKELDFWNEGYESLVASDNALLSEKWSLRIPDLEVLLAECGLADETDYKGDPAKWLRFSRLLALFRASYSLPDVLKKLLCAIPIPINNDVVEDYIDNVAFLRRNVMGSMAPASWREFMQPINDGLRSRRRDALAAYVCWKSQQQNSGASFYPMAFIDTNDLYNYYLTDVEMEPDMSTSRIRQALNSVQQFVQRALLGLEGRFTLTEEQKSFWKWMKNYRVWEANRKVFLYAENWIEPELRDDKTLFFKELEDKLMKVSDEPDSMEEALAEYLDKMVDVGGLQIVGACKEDGGDAALYTLHIIGRTRAEPGVFYYRCYLAKALYGGEWTPWERIDAEIQAKSVSMAVMNQNLYVFWPDIQHKEEEAEAYPGEMTLGESQSKSILELRLNWIRFNGKKWSGKKTTKSVLSHVLYDSHGHKLNTGESYEDRFHFHTASNSSDFLQVKVYRTWYDYDESFPIETKITVETGRKTLRKTAVYQPSEFQMIEHFGEFQLWKDGNDEATYHGGSWSRKDAKNYVFFYSPANSNLIHNYWTGGGLLENYQEPDSDIDIGNEPQPPKKKWYETQKKYKKRKEKWLKKYLEWRELTDIAEEANENIQDRGNSLAFLKPDEAGKLVYPSGNIILGKIDGPYVLYPVNFSFYTEDKLPFFFMGEDKTYLVEEVARDKGVATTPNGYKSYRFNLLTHPLVDEFHKRYRSGGREWLYTRETEALPMAEGYYRSYSYYNYYFSVYLGYHIAGDWEAWDLSQSLFEYRYQPQRNVVTRPFPNPVVDFSWGSANGIYNWELFFHVPMLIASKLTQEQRYEEAMDWMHMVFDPRMDLSVYERTKRWAQNLPKGSRFWRFLPFFANKDADANILETLGIPGARNKTPDRDALEALIDRWRRDPFNPHLIARARPAAYQKFVVMKYLDNLIAWADRLFTIDTMESVSEAIQLYMLAADILGPKEAKTDGANFTEALDVLTVLNSKQEILGNVMVQVENDLIQPNNQEKTMPQPKLSAEAGQLVQLSGSMLYFGVPRNEKLQAYWATIADRFYKIRNSLNIEGIKRVLALYDPPIDPTLLVRARAMGLDISSVLSSLSAPLPLYRFQFMAQKAMEVARDVQSLGTALLSVLEKKDGEALSILRVEQERDMLALNKNIRKLQLDEVNAHLNSLQKNRESAEMRYAFYKDIEKYSTKEILAMSLTGAADALQVASAATLMGASIMAKVPDAEKGGIANAFGGPYFGLSYGGTKISAAATNVASSLQIASQLSRSSASLTQTMAGYDRRWNDWKLQEKLAKMEMESLDKQILAAEIRVYMAEKEMENLERQIEQSSEIYEFMKNRFTSQELYTWMATELGNLYKDTFQQALAVAQSAERCYQFELGLEDSSVSIIRPNYWNSLRQGLLAGERLLSDLRRMDIAFIEKNERELEITRAVSLDQLNPEALRSLQESGNCIFDVPEVLFDMDFPGQYFRRIKTVRLEIHCNVPPHASISAKLTLLNNYLRPSDNVSGEYENPDNYLDNRIGVQSIATSQAQNDSGLFELNFRDERYLPFEGAGAISEWKLELPAQFQQFEYQKISNAVLHISYTARDSDVLKDKAIGSITRMWNAYQTLSGEGLKQEIRLNRDYHGSLQQLRTGMPVSLQIGDKDFPAFTKGLARVNAVRIFAKGNKDVNKFKLEFKLEGSIAQTKITKSFNAGKWTEIWSLDGLDLSIQGEWLLDASKTDGEQLNNLGDIMIEYRYHLGNSGEN